MCIKLLRLVNRSNFEKSCQKTYFAVAAHGLVSEASLSLSLYFIFSGHESRTSLQSRGWISQGFATNLVLSLLMVIAICAIIMVSELGSVIHSENLAQESSSGMCYVA